jgi:hypothetical protein
MLDLDRDYVSDNCDPEDAATDRIKSVTDEDRAKSVENMCAAMSDTRTENPAGENNDA